MKNYRWTICALLFFATTINYLDRAVIGLLKETLTGEFNWSESDYGNIIICFQVAYAVSLLGVGWIIDKVGTKLGYTLSMIVWSVAAVFHAFARGTVGFGAARAMLGAGEAGNFPAANKTVAEWFPLKERALATGIYNSGSTIGAIVAPIAVPFIAIQWGWKWAFIATGLIGFIWLVFWLLCYRAPDKAQVEAMQAEQPEPEESTAKVSWFRLLGYKQTWAFVVGKFFSDPVWWFFLFWLPAFLKSEYGLTGMQVSLPLIVVYAISSVGSVFGGWLPKRMIEAGRSESGSRKTSMLVYALIPLLVLVAQWAGRFNMWYAIIIIALACAAHCAWMANLFATVSDMFPKKAVASVTGIGGMAGSVGGILIAWAAGLLFDHYKAMGDIRVGYGIMFMVCAVAYLIAWLIMHFLVPKYKRLDI